MASIGELLIIALVAVVLFILSKLIEFDIDGLDFNEDDHVEGPDGEEVIYDEDTQE